MVPSARLIYITGFSVGTHSTSSSQLFKVEILVKYNQLDYILAQIDETKKKPRAGTSPLVAVPLRLDLTEDQLDKILRNM